MPKDFHGVLSVLPHIIDPDVDLLLIACHDVPPINPDLNMVPKAFHDVPSINPDLHLVPNACHDDLPAH